MPFLGCKSIPSPMAGHRKCHYSQLPPCFGSHYRCCTMPANRRTAVMLMAQSVEQTWSESTRQALNYCSGEGRYTSLQAHGLWKDSGSYTIVAPSQKWRLLLDDLDKKIQIYPPSSSSTKTATALPFGAKRAVCRPYGNAPKQLWLKTLVPW